MLAYIVIILRVLFEGDPHFSRSNFQRLEKHWSRTGDQKVSQRKNDIHTSTLQYIHSLKLTQALQIVLSKRIKRKVVSQPLILRFHIRFREGMSTNTHDFLLWAKSVKVWIFRAVARYQLFRIFKPPLLPSENRRSWKKRGSLVISIDSVWVKPPATSSWAIHFIQDHVFGACFRE